MLLQAESSLQIAMKLIHEKEVPKNVVAGIHSVLGEVYLMQGRTDDARRELEKALSLNPQKCSYAHAFGILFPGGVANRSGPQEEGGRTCDGSV